MRRTILIGMVLTLVVAACGDDDGTATNPASSPSDASTATADSTPPHASPSTLGTDESMDDGQVMGDVMDEGDHDHDHDDVFEWDGGEPPVVTVTVVDNGVDGLAIGADISNFDLSDPSETDHVAGRGHTHVYVDGRLITMSYEAVVVVSDLEPGPHTATVTLSNNAHTDYAIDGTVISGSTTFVVAGDESTADVVVEARYESGQISGIEGRVTAAIGDIVEITLFSDTADELHVHGYDIFGDVTAGSTVVVRFVADIPGIFEVELEDAGIDLLELRVG